MIKRIHIINITRTKIQDFHFLIFPSFKLSVINHSVDYKLFQIIRQVIEIL